MRDPRRRASAAPTRARQKKHPAATPATKSTPGRLPDGLYLPANYRTVHRKAQGCSYARTVRCADSKCELNCQHHRTPCQRPVITFYDPISLTSERINKMLTDCQIAAHAAKNPRLLTCVTRGQQALAAFELEIAESLLEEAEELLIGIQQRLLTKTNLSDATGD